MRWAIGKVNMPTTAYVVAFWLFVNAGGARAEWPCAPGEASCKTVVIVHNSWHAAIVLRRDELSVDVLPEMGDFPDAKFLEFSWGDQDYFPDPNSGVWAALRAGFWSGGSVMHMVSFQISVSEFYRGAEIIELRYNPSAHEKLLRYIARRFARPVIGAPAPPRPGLFAYSRFYPSRQKFSILRTCNTWVAEALESAGLPILPRMVLTAGNLASQVAPLVKSKSAQ